MPDATDKPTEPQDDKATDTGDRAGGLRLSEADLNRRLARAEKRGAELAVKDLLGRLELESVDSIDELKQRLTTAASTQTESEKLKAEHGKVAKKLAEAEKAVAELTRYRHETIRAKAIAPLASKFRAPADLEAYLAPRLAVKEDGSVAGLDGKSLDDTVKALLDEHPHLRASDHRPGAGTRPITTGSGPNGEDKRTPQQRLAAEMAAFQLQQESRGP